MRTILAVLAVCAAVTAKAQMAPTVSTTQNATEELSTRKLALPPLNPSLIYLRPEKPNEIRLDRTSVDGVLVHFIKRENPLQLINPVATPPYTSMDNVALDSISQKVTGWKLFSISF